MQSLSSQPAESGEAPGELYGLVVRLLREGRDRKKSDQIQVGVQRWSHRLSLASGVQGIYR